MPRLRLLYLSDLHLSPWSPSRGVLDQVTHWLEYFRPDWTLLGGDLVDVPGCLAELQHWLVRLRSFCPVAVISGNHDRWIGVSPIRQCVQNHGAFWFDDQLDLGRLTLWAELQLWNPAAHVPGEGCNLLVAHNPRIFPLAMKHKIPLVLAGHLHGCQCHWFSQSITKARVSRVPWLDPRPAGNYSFPGAWFFTYNGPFFHQANTTMLVSAGINDTLPIRWNCPRDGILIDCQPASLNQLECIQDSLGGAHQIDQCQERQGNG